MTGVTKAVVCGILCGVKHIKEPLLVIGKYTRVVPALGLLSHYMNGPLLCCITENNTLNKTFLSFLLLFLWIHVR